MRVCWLQGLSDRLCMLTRTNVQDYTRTGRY
jgi:hypothetical protein